jgi:MFS family permease
MALSQRIGIGGDLDGGYGSEQTPADLDTVADRRKLPELLRKGSCSENDLRAVMHGNGVRFFSEVLPAGPDRAANRGRWGDMWGNFGAALSPVLLAAVSQRFGWPAIFLACALAFLLAGGCGLLLNANRPLVGEVVDSQP